MNSRCRFALLLGGTLAAGIAAAERRDHDAHVHGRAEMDVAALGGTAEIVLRSPAVNLVGFEHEPRSDEERERSRVALASLRDGESLFAFEGAGCRLDEAWARWHHEARDHAEDADHDHAGSHGHDDDHEHEHEQGHREHDEGHGENIEEGHSEIHAHYHFDCEGVPSAIATGLFERFPGTEEIRVQFITDDTQGAQVLTPGSSRLVLE